MCENRYTMTTQKGVVVYGKHKCKYSYGFRVKAAV